MLIGRIGLEDDVLLGIPGVVAARSLDPIPLVETAVEPNGGVECSLLVDEEMGELGFEGVGGRFIRKVSAELLPGFADRVGDSVDQLANAPLAPVLLALDARLAEILGHGDVGGELAPSFGNLRPFELEHDRAVGIRDLAVSKHVLDRLERILARLGQTPLHGEAAVLLRDLRPAGAFHFQIARHSPSF